MPKLEITSQERSALRAAAHPLRPVVLIGDRGLSDSVLKEIDLNLNAHQLIKVRIAGEERDARNAMLETICDSLSCALVHHLGKTLIIYRPDVAAQKAKADAENATRATRKPSEPYTPKKQAAEGVTRTRRSEKAKRATLKAESTEKAAPRARRASAPADRPAHGIPRRAGSALSLRAGRRSLTRSGKR
ncbi:YhbY family RNA-binding protein [Pusillimonas sp. MFBS29]|uniref:YhbY family RNA-binding protein n=1 Tax=Pusillimonas sp. MFBS29 TaxID=2886690 RepID=UPI001D112875|nr:YhbY family RNA-binding protein [Pusillimonas sp. MFBS29]MCC2597365.1 YhbY family RNA-binding protein [Pusillimonas sp. MFBS29]